MFIWVFSPLIAYCGPDPFSSIKWHNSQNPQLLKFDKFTVWFKSIQTCLSNSENQTLFSHEILFTKWFQINKSGRASTFWLLFFKFSSNVGVFNVFVRTLIHISSISLWHLHEINSDMVMTFKKNKKDDRRQKVDGLGHAMKLPGSARWGVYSLSS